MSRIAHGQLSRPGAWGPLLLDHEPEWHHWRTQSETARAMRWIENYVHVPTGYNAGSLLKLAAFQRRIMRTIYTSRATFVSLPTGNAKTTLLAAIALERVCRGDDYAEVVMLATKHEQAGMMAETAKRMVESQELLWPLCKYQMDAAALEYRPTGSKLLAHPAKLAAVQGLNFSLAIVDEFGFADDAVVESLIARLGKRPDSRIIGIGTPGFEPNVMFRMRERARAKELPREVAWLEWSAPNECALDDRNAWRKANPALAAGFLSPDALEAQLALVDEAAFRVYHLGQWIDSPGGWLPPGAWVGCPFAAPPPDGSEVVLGIEGTYRRTTAIMGASLDGAVFFVWAGEIVTDEELRAIIEQASEQWNVVEIVVAPRIRPRLFQELEQDGLPLYRWKPADDIAAADELFRAIVDNRLAHDHTTLVDEQVGHIAARHASDGTLRLGRPDSGTWVDAGLAVRLCWWRAAELAMVPEVVAPSVF